MVVVYINNNEYSVREGLSILETCKYIGIPIPRFCFHETLSVAGNCRVCLVEIEGIDKPVASCVTDIEDDIEIWVNNTFIKKARENIFEFLLLNHPLDCPICDQAGECDLQDQAKIYGNDYSRFSFYKRGVEDKDCGVLIKTIMTRCIHCTRCVRFGFEVAGKKFFNTLNRGVSTEIGAYVSGGFISEISGNVIDLCPVGALTSKPYSFKSRPWELRMKETIDLTDGFGSNINVDYKESEVYRVLPKVNLQLNGYIITDKARFSYDALKYNRIKVLYKKNKSNQFDVVKWDFFFEKISLMLSEQPFITVLINNNIDFEGLALLIKLNNKYLNRIKVKQLGSLKEENNFFFFKEFSSVEEIKKSGGICYLISTNPKLECSVLNAKLRFKYNQNFYNIYCLGYSFFYNIKSKFIYFSLNNVLNFWESKNNLSLSLIKNSNPLVIFGEGLNSRLNSTSKILTLLREKICSVKIIKIVNCSNYSGVQLLNVPSVNSKVLKISRTLVATGLEDTLNIRRILSKKEFYLLWLNSHGSSLTLKSNLIAPLLTQYECNSIHLNLEYRPQNSKKIIECKNESRSFKTIIAAISENIQLSGFEYLLELLKDPYKFELLSKQYFFINSSLNSKHKISLYPLKSSAEDFFLSNSFTKQSKIMIECSKHNRQNFDFLKKE